MNGNTEAPEGCLILTGAPMAIGSKVEVRNIPLNKIKLGRNSRLSVSKEELAGLMQSIKEQGLLQPIGVVKSGTGFEIAYGNRRFMATSKLGLSHIPAIVHESKKRSDIDLKNLTENIQRRNISLQEAGRYIELLRGEELTVAEIAVRLGVSHGYIDSCVKAFKEVPKEFRDDLEVRVTNQKKAPGKIAIGTARKILSAAKTFRLDSDEVKKLFHAAKSNEKFEETAVNRYASALKHGKKDFVGTVKPLRSITPSFLVTAEHADELTEKFVTNGPFKSLTGLMRAILRGEKSVKIDVL